MKYIFPAKQWCLELEMKVENTMSSLYSTVGLFQTLLLIPISFLGFPHVYVTVSYFILVLFT